MTSGFFRFPSMLRSTVLTLASVYGALRPLVLAATCSVLYVALHRLKMRIFWEMTSRVTSAFSAYLFDSGYMFCVSLRGVGTSRIFYVKVYSCTHSANCAASFLVKGVDMPSVGLSARSFLPSLIRKWPRSSFTTVVWLVLHGTMHLALCLHFTLCSLVVGRPLGFWHHDRFGRLRETVLAARR